VGNEISRRDLLRLLPVSFAAPLFAQHSLPIRAFQIHVPRATIDRILNRVRETHLPDRLDAPDWRYGVNWDYMKSLVDYWKNQFDWQRTEAILNRHSQFLTRIDDFDVHFYFAKSRHRNSQPLILTHGWPGSVFEFLEVIDPLSDPTRFGGSADDAFDVVVPSIPGFGFSSKPQSPIGPPTVARIWHKLMTEVLGYSKFGAQGGDWGSAITLALASEFPGSLTGIHLNAAPISDPPKESALTHGERVWREAAAAYTAQEFDYFNEQQHKPGTVAFALYDNPVGTAAWMVEKFKVWSDSGDDLEHAFTKDQLLSNVMIYLVTDTTATSIWFYRGNADDSSGVTSTRKLMVPMGFASFPGEMVLFNPPRIALERDYNLVHYSKMPKGGHFACLEQPQLFVEDVRKFFRKLRT
jgi:epoxide hydrolase